MTWRRALACALVAAVAWLAAAVAALWYAMRLTSDVEA